MIELGGEPRFPGEACQTFAVGSHFGGQDFQRDLDVPPVLSSTLV
jgi:hypothetical protein